MKCCFFYQFTLASSQITKKFVRRQMIEVLARPTNNANHFVDKGKEANLSAKTSQHFSLVCMRYLASTGPTSDLLSFVSMWCN